MPDEIKHLGLAPGIHYNISEADYHADRLCAKPTLSRSEAKTLVDDCPLLLWAAHPRLGGRNQTVVTKKMDFGSAAHAIVLGRGAEIITVDAENWMTKAAKEARESIREQGKTPLLAREKEQADTVVAALNMRLKEFGMLDGFNRAKSETVLLWEESENVMCRAMADKLDINEETGSAHFFDVKFCESANPKWLGKHFAEMGYGLQDQWYIHGLEQLLPKFAGRMDFTFLLQETSYPFIMVPVRLSGDFKGASISKVMRAIDTWKKCIEQGRWPGYTTEIVTLEPPPWLLPSEMGAKSVL